MGRDLYGAFGSAKAVFDKADDILGFSLSRLCFEGPEEELRQTINAQPAILTVSLACMEAIKETSGGKGFPSAAFVAGHSLGEYTALAVASVIDFDTAVYLSRERGRLMHEAGLRNPGGMVAVIGLDEAVLQKICWETDTFIANINSPGQLVISGAQDNIIRAADLAKAKGAKRTVPLVVSGAFHTPLMQPAVAGMLKIIDKLPFDDPVIPIIANTTAKPMSTAEMVKEELLRQLCNSIDWVGSVRLMVKEGVSTLVEIGPGKVLSGLIKRIDDSVETVNIGDAEAVENVPSLFP
jgi:[acyl-carrier-protein] S-malonyltransferase